MTTMTSEEIRIGQLAIRFLVEGEETGGALAVFEFDVPAGAKVPIAAQPRRLRGDDLRTRGRPDLDGRGRRRPTSGPARRSVIPRGAVHHFENTGEVDATALAIVTPGILGPAYFRDVAAVLAAAAGGPPDLAAIADVMRRHGLTPAP